MESALQKLITSSAGFTALASTRLYPVLLPDEAKLPAATYQTISAIPIYALEGRINLTQYRVQIEVFATTYTGAKGLAAAISDVIDAYSGVLADGSRFDSVTLESYTDLYQSDARVYSVSTDWIIQFAA